MVVNRHILCIDAGYRHLGVAVYSSTLKQFVYVRCFELDKITSGKVIDDSLSVIRRQVFHLDVILARYSVQQVLAELPTGASRSSRAVRAMAQATAIIVTFCACRNLRLEVISPHQIKRLVSKKGSVDKDSVIRFMRKQRGTELLNSVRPAVQEHVADAMACLEVYRKDSLHAQRT